jgi:M6 family metalloprotease-like protein
MKTNKKILTVILVLILAVIFSGCGIILRVAQHVSDKLIDEIKNNIPEVTDTREIDYGDTDSGIPLLEGVDEIPVMVVLINYSDEKVDTADAVWAEKYFGDKDSVAVYYDDMSQGNLNLLPAEEDIGTPDDGIVEVTINEPLPDNARVWDDATVNLWKEYYQAVESEVDFSQFDINGDGVVLPTELSVIFVVPGYDDTNGAEGLRETVWPHMYMIYSEYEAVNVDDVDLVSYYMVPEHTYNYMKDKIGIVTLETLCHEFGHLLGLPDMYDITDYSLGIGPHGLMGGSLIWLPDDEYNETPVELDGWSKEYLGFIEPEVVTESGVYELSSLDTGEENMLKIPIKNSQEYFLLENRMFTLYNRGLGYYCSDPGIIIWHVDQALMDSFKYTVYGYELYDNGINDDYDNKGIEVVEASLGEVGYSQLDAYEDPVMNSNYVYDHYFTAGDVFSYSTVPDSNAKNGSDSGITVEVLSVGETSEVEITIE